MSLQVSARPITSEHLDILEALSISKDPDPVALTVYEIWLQTNREKPSPMAIDSNPSGVKLKKRKNAFDHLREVAKRARKENIAAQSASQKRIKFLSSLNPTASNIEKFLERLDHIQPEKKIQELERRIRLLLLNREGVPDVTVKRLSNAYSAQVLAAQPKLLNGIEALRHLNFLKDLLISER